MTRSLFAILLVAAIAPAKADPPAPGSPEALVERAIQAAGGRKALQASTDSEILECCRNAVPSPS